MYGCLYPSRQARGYDITVKFTPKVKADKNVALPVDQLRVCARTYHPDCFCHGFWELCGNVTAYVSLVSVIVYLDRQPYTEPPCDV